MAYLTGNTIYVLTQTLRKHIGDTVQYLLDKDIDKSGRGYFFPKTGIITDVHNRHVEFDGNQDYIPFSQVREMVFRSNNVKEGD